MIYGLSCLLVFKILISSLSHPQNDKKMVEIVTNLLGEKPIGRTLNVDWQAVARQLKTGRTSKQCRDRWMNHLRPGLKKGNWTKREAKEIITLHKKLGPK